MVPPEQTTLETYVEESKGTVGYSNVRSACVKTAPSRFSFRRELVLLPPEPAHANVMFVPSARVEREYGFTAGGMTGWRVVVVPFVTVAVLLVIGLVTLLLVVEAWRGLS